MNPEMMAHCRSGTRALAASSPLDCAKALIEGLAKHNQGARDIVLRYLNAEIKFLNPRQPDFSLGAGEGVPAVVAATSAITAAAGTAHSHRRNRR
jgi:hypothetical protein